jgi:dolichyl-phosphate-mannose-protein mannosyltransferase
VTATLPDWMPRPEAVDQPAEPTRPQRPVPPALIPWRDPKPWLAWAIAGGLAVLAGFTRFWGLGFPNSKIFDEAYYPVEAQEIMRYGYEDNRGYMFIVHPPLGKWLIGWTSELFGNGLSDAFGWRVAPAIFGSLSVLLMFVIARRLFRSNLFGAIAGVLIALDGLSLVLARTAILDCFLQFFVLAGFAGLVLDRDQMRARLGGLLADGADLTNGVPALGPRPWRLLAGVMFGLACATKWTGTFFFAFFVLLSLLWDRGAFRVAGVKQRNRATARRSLVPALGSLLAVPIVAYLFCYLGWFVGENGWGRHYADTHSAATHLHLLGASVPWTWAWVPGPIRSLGSYTLNAYRFHETLFSPHAYGSNPWSWLVLGRPVDFYYSGDYKNCGAPSCSREVLLIGTPVLWWAFVPMLLWLAWHYLTTRDWRAAAVWVAFIAGWVVWFQDLKRTMFLFYMAPLVPFLILGLTLALGVMLGPALRRTGDEHRDERSFKRRRWGQLGACTFLALVVVDFVWMWPIFTGGLVTYDVWHAHMWLPSWV